MKRREDPVDLTRRDLGKLALAAIPASRLLAKPNSNFDGVQVGVITYSYRSMSGANDAEALLKYIVDSGISGIELMGPAAEIYAGSPASAGRGGGGGGGRGGGGRRRGAGTRWRGRRSRPGTSTRWRWWRPCAADSRAAGRATGQSGRFEGVAFV